MKNFIKNKKVCTIISNKLSSKIIAIFILLFTSIALFTGCSSTEENSGLNNIVVDTDNVPVGDADVISDEVTQTIETDFIEDDIEIGELI